MHGGSKREEEPVLALDQVHVGWTLTRDPPESLGFQVMARSPGGSKLLPAALHFTACACGPQTGCTDAVSAAVD